MKTVRMCNSSGQSRQVAENRECLDIRFNQWYSLEVVRQGGQVAVIV